TPRDLHPFPTRRSSDLPGCASGASGSRDGSSSISGIGGAPLGGGGSASVVSLAKKPSGSLGGSLSLGGSGSGSGAGAGPSGMGSDRKSTRLNSSHVKNS